MNSARTAAQITALLVAKNNMDAGRPATLNMGVGSNAERQWLLDALAVLLQAELERRQ
jgi:hypothetical protein